MVVWLPTSLMPYHDITRSLIFVINESILIDLYNLSLLQQQHFQPLRYLTVFHCFQPRFKDLIIMAELAQRHTVSQIDTLLIFQSFCQLEHSTKWKNCQKILFKIIPDLRPRSSCTTIIFKLIQNILSSQLAKVDI